MEIKFDFNSRCIIVDQAKLTLIHNDIPRIQRSVKVIRQEIVLLFLHINLAALKFIIQR